MIGKYDIFITDCKMSSFNILIEWINGHVFTTFSYWRIEKRLFKIRNKNSRNTVDSRFYNFSFVITIFVGVLITNAYTYIHNNNLINISVLTMQKLLWRRKSTIRETWCRSWSSLWQVDEVSLSIRIMVLLSKCILQYRLWNIAHFESPYI